MTFLQRCEGDVLELLRDLDVLRAELLRGPLEDPRARVLGAVDAMAEAHDPLAAGERLLDPCLRVAHRGDLLEHRLDVRRRATVERAGERPTADESAAPQSAPVDATT